MVINQRINLGKIVVFTKKVINVFHKHELNKMFHHGNGLYSYLQLSATDSLLYLYTVDVC